VTDEDWQGPRGRSRIPTFHGSVDFDTGAHGDPWTLVADHLPSCGRNEFNFVRRYLTEWPMSGQYGGICLDCGAMVVEEDEQAVRVSGDALHEAKVRHDRARMARDAHVRDLARRATIDALRRDAADMETVVSGPHDRLTTDLVLNACQKIRGVGKKPTMATVAVELGISESTLRRFRRAAGLDAWPPDRPGAKGPI